MRSLIFSLLTLPFLITGCSTPHAFPTPDAAWETHIGQLKYTRKQTTLIGDVVVQQRGTDQFQLLFSKTGSLPLMTLREDGNIARTEGLLVNSSWQGKPESATNTLKPWLALPDALKQPRPTVLGGIKLWQGQAEYNDHKLSSLWLYFPEYDQRFVFQFNP